MTRTHTLESKFKLNQELNGSFFRVFIPASLYSLYKLNYVYYFETSLISFEGSTIILVRYVIIVNHEQKNNSN